MTDTATPAESRTPVRVRMSRSGPWRKEWPDAVIIDRRGPRGNPFIVRPGPYTGPWVPVSTAADAVRRHLITLVTLVTRDVHAVRYQMPTVADIRDALAGRDLACWCWYGNPCHGNTLLHLANDPPDRLAAWLAAEYPGLVDRLTPHLADPARSHLITLEAHA